MSPRFASASTSRPAARAWRATSASAAQPAAPSRSKQASCGLTATHAAPAASTTARQCPATAAAARSAGDPPAGAGEAAAGHRRIGSGSSPRTTWDSRPVTASTSRSPKGSGRASLGPPLSGLECVSAVDGLLEARARGEARHFRGRDLDRLARARVHTLAGAALGDVELPEARESHVAAALQRVLDDVEDGVDRLTGFFLPQVGLRGDLVDEL